MYKRLEIQQVTAYKDCIRSIDVQCSKIRIPINSEENSEPESYKQYLWKR